MEWISFLGSILGGLIGGIFTFLGVKLTLKHDKEKEHKEILLKANENKPRLEVVKYYDFNAENSGPFIKEEKDLTLQFRGSKHQRIIDMKATGNAEIPVIWEQKLLH